MDVKNKTDDFQEKIEEISREGKSKENMQKKEIEQNSRDKFGKHKEFKKQNWQRRNRNNQKFRDKDFKERKDFGEQKEIKPSLGSLGAMSELAREKLSEALNKKVESVVSISKQEGGWRAEIEVIDEEYLPDIELKSMNDVIGLYEIQLDDNNELTSWDKKSSRKRGEVR